MDRVLATSDTANLIEAMTLGSERCGIRSVSSKYGPLDVDGSDGAGGGGGGCSMSNSNELLVSRLGEILGTFDMT